MSVQGKQKEKGPDVCNFMKIITKDRTESCELQDPFFSDLR